MFSLWPLFVIFVVFAIGAIIYKLCKDLALLNQKNKYQNVDNQREVRVIRKGKMRHPETEEILDCIMFKRNDEDNDIVYVTEKEDFYERYQPEPIESDNIENAE